jgi:3-dehydroquinate synthase
MVKSSVHDYNVEFVNNLKDTLSNELKDGDFIIIDSRIKELYGPEINEIISQNKTLSVDAIEPNKSYQGVEIIISDLISNGLRKNNRLVAIGGGIIQDITAFIASIMYRGLDWILLPTTLLSQGDSCIGSKTSINFGEYKNQVGGFYPPNKIIINCGFLDSLPDEQLKSGLGEMLHYFIVSGKVDFQRFVNDYPLALTNKSVLTSLISRSLMIKKGFIEIDEFDCNERQVLNYGHSFGHAIESLTDYSIPHGIAVCRGMDIANFISMKLGYITHETRLEIRELGKKIWAGFDISNISIEGFKNALSKDKKNVGNKLGLILMKGYGEVFKEMRPMDDEFTNWIIEYFKTEI